MKNLNAIEKRMAQLTVLIKETRDRLPAHSTKPPVMMELIGYEDEYEDLRKQRDKIINGFGTLIFKEKTDKSKVNLIG